MKDHYPTVAIIALNFGTTDDEIHLLQQVLGVKVKQVQGCWNGQQENAYIVPMPPSPCPEFKAKLVKLTRIYNQESFFVLLPPDATGRRRCISFNKEDFHHAKQEGYFVACTQSQAYKHNGWTFDIATGVHYILEEN